MTVVAQKIPMALDTDCESCLVGISSMDSKSAKICAVIVYMNESHLRIETLHSSQGEYT